LKKYVPPELIYFARKTPKMILMLLIEIYSSGQKGEKDEFDRV